MRRISFIALIAALFPLIASAQGSGVQFDQPEELRFPTLYRTDNVEVVSFGYLRSFGFGGSIDGGPLRCFQLPLAPVKYRLGNECDFYLELGLITTLGNRQDGPNLDINLRGALAGSEANSYDDWERFLVEAWAGYDDFVDEGPLAGARIWAGQRFYYRQDTHIQDFYYWNATGMGYGIEQIPFGKGQLAFAVFEHSSFGVDTALDDGTPYRRYEVRVEEWQETERVLLRGALDLRFAKDGYETRSDHGGRFVVESEISEALRGDWSLTFQLGWGAGHGLDYVSDPLALPDEIGARAIASYLTNRGDDFALSATAVLEAQSHDREWISIGARPIWRIAESPFYWSTEAGIDVARDSGETQAFAKVTGALAWRPGGPDFFSRPSFRLYASYADWNETARKAGLAPSFTGSHGATYGVQIETWW